MKKVFDPSRFPYVFLASVYLQRKQMSEKPCMGPGGGWGTWVNFCWVCAAGLSEPHLIVIYSVRQICYFRDPNLVTFCFYELNHFFRLNEEHFTFHLRYKHSGTLLTVNMKNCLTPKNPKMCDPILVTLLKMRPHYRQSSRENATPSTGTSPLTSYKKVLPPPTPGCLGAFGCRLRV